MYTLYIYKGHWENDVFLRDYLIDKKQFKNIRDIRDYFSISADFNEFDYLIESPYGEFNSIYRFNF